MTDGEGGEGGGGLGGGAWAKPPKAGENAIFRIIFMLFSGRFFHLVAVLFFPVANMGKEHAGPVHFPSPSQMQLVCWLVGWLIA